MEGGGAMLHRHPPSTQPPMSTAVPPNCPPATPPALPHHIHPPSFTQASHGLPPRRPACPLHAQRIHRSRRVLGPPTRPVIDAKVKQPEQ
eukprot:358017-Chlamydomonas_euryale.AAC.2